MDSQHWLAVVLTQIQIYLTSPFCCLPPFLFIYNVYIHICLQSRIILLDEFLCFTSPFEANVPEFFHEWSPTRHRRLYFVFLRVFHWGIRSVTLSIGAIRAAPESTTILHHVSCVNISCLVTTN